jgi:ribose transport system ATP-binding protein
MLEVRNLYKNFGGIVALNDVSVAFYPGEIHALLGENGAGKSTLIKIISGIFRADSGKVYIDDKEMKFSCMADSLRYGISIIAQEIQAIPDSSIAENIMLDRLDKFTKYHIINWAKLYDESKRFLDMVGLDLSPKMKVRGLSTAQKQLVQIAKALALDSDILLCDEPTSALTLKEAENLFKILKKLKSENKTIIFVSHKIEEVISLCDKISVLRDGKYVGTRSCSGITKQEIIKMMIGRETTDEFYGFLDVQDKKVLEAKNICQEGKFNNLNFYLKKGEILGFYGLIGSGRTELARIIIGEDKKTSGEIIVNGKMVSIRCMADALSKYKIGYVSENRKEGGLILSATVKTNIAITIWRDIRRSFIKLLDLKKENQIVDDVIDKLQIKTPSSRQTVLNLSGGNQQKVSFAKWIAANCDILIIDEPTIGVDVGAKESIQKLIWEFAKERGKSIILISSDMPELIKLSRRILIFRDYKIVGEINNLNDKEFSYADISNEIGQYIAQ